MENQIEKGKHIVTIENKNWYDKTHKLLLIIPLIFLLFSVIYLYNFNNKNGDVIYKDVSLTGGTTISVFDSNVNIDSLKAALSQKFPDIGIRGISDIQTGKQIGVIIETKADKDQIKPEIEEFLGYSLTNENSSTEFSGAAVSQGFYNQLIDSLLAAFLLMSAVVFWTFADSKYIKGIVIILAAVEVKILIPKIPIFTFITFTLIVFGLIYGLYSNKEKSKNKYYLLLGTFAIAMIIYFLELKQFLLIPIFLILIYLYITHSMPSFMVILCAFADIIMTITVVNLLGITLSLAGIIAFLMLIGYSVDTDILMTTRLLKEKTGSKNHRIWEAFKTGIMMTITSISAVGISLLIIRNLSTTLSQIFTILLIGLCFDIFNTWITNASLLKWYVEAKKIE